jgi:hypothetical protein
MMPLVRWPVTDVALLASYCDNDNNDARAARCGDDSGDEMR